MKDKRLLYLILGIVGLSAVLWAIVFIQSMQPRNAGIAMSSRPTPTPTLSAVECLSTAKSIIESNPTYDDMIRANKLLGEIEPETKEYKEAKALRLKITTYIEREEKKQQEQLGPELRERLKDDYQSIIAAANPHLNYIGSKITKTKGGYALWATHTYFSQYSLTIGEDAHVIEAWIDKNRSELKQAGIVRVGLMGTESYAGSSYFDLK
jgi:hypothetical protein